MRALIFTLALAGCASPTPPPVPAPPQPDTCGIARFAHMIGAQADDINRAALPPGARILAPNQAVTMDYSAQRLNLMTDAQGRIVELRCF